MLLTCEMDAVALKVYELKSKCGFCEYHAPFFLLKKILPSGSKTELYVLVVGSVEKFHTRGIIVKTKSNGTNHSSTITNNTNNNITTNKIDITTTSTRVA